MVLAGSNVGEMYKLEKDRVVLGRGDKVDLRLLDDGISREHAPLSRDGGQFVLEDLGSTNGTYCNGERVSGTSSPRGTRSCSGSTTILKFSYQDRLDEAFQRQMSESALRDGLTHAYNKRYFGERLESEFQFAPRHDSPLALVFLDIDHFKRINDVHGHQAGDYVLTQLSSLIIEHARRGRHLRALRRRGVRDHRARHRRGARPRRWPSACAAASRAHAFASAADTIPVTISVGVARAPAPGISSPVELVSRADEAMYAAKRSGRNRVCVDGVRPPPRAPTPRPRQVSVRGLRQRAAQARQVFGARDVDRAQAFQVRRRHLRVAQREAAGAQPLDRDGRPPPSTRRWRGGTSIRRRRSRPWSRRRGRRPALRRPRPPRCGRGRAGEARCRRA